MNPNDWLLQLMEIVKFSKIEHLNFSKMSSHFKEKMLKLLFIDTQ